MIHNTDRHSNPFEAAPREDKMRGRTKAVNMNLPSALEWSKRQPDRALRPSSRSARAGALMGRAPAYGVLTKAGRRSYTSGIATATARTLALDFRMFPVILQSTPG